MSVLLYLIAMATYAMPTQLDTLHCPQNCSCATAPETGLTVTCLGGNASDIINNLPQTTVHFRYTYDNPFSDSNCRFRNNTMLETIVLTSSVSYGYKMGHSRMQNAELFWGVGEVRELHIHLMLYTLDSKVLEPLGKLEVLDLSHTRSLTRENMEDILRSTTVFHPRLKKLLIRNFFYPVPVKDNLSDVASSILQPLNGSQIEELDISMNELVFNTPGISQYLPNLKVFRSINNLNGYSASYGYICAFLDFMLHPLLERLEIGHHNVNDRPVRVKRSLSVVDPFRDLYNCLNNINISSPCSKDLKCDIGRCLCNGKDAIPVEHIPSLDMWTGPKGVTVPLKKLKYLDMANAVAMLYPRINVPSAESIMKFYFKNNSLQYVDISNNANHWLPSSEGLDNIRYLYVQNNNIELTTRNFRQFRDLLVVHVGGNRVTFEKNTTLFDVNSNLIELSMKNCGVKTIPSHEITYLKRLQTLELDQNEISDFGMDLRNLSDLRFLNLSRNRISNLPPNVTTALSDLAASHDIILDLTGNPLSCGCSDFGFVVWLKATRVTIPGLLSLTCNHPTLRLVSVVSVNFDDLQKICSPSYATLIISSICGTLLVVLLIVCIIMVRRNKWTIRYYVDAARQRWKQGRATRTDASSANYTHDAFLVYSAEDRFWVHDELLEYLESQHGLKLCIHYRDFIPGHDIEDTIIDTLKNSRKAIVVLSPHFLRSNWCHFEVKMARQIEIEENRDMIILVILRSISACKMSKTLASMLQHRTYLIWENNADCKRLFWSQIVRAVKGSLATSSF